VEINNKIINTSAIHLNMKI